LRCFASLDRSEPFKSSDSSLVCLLKGTYQHTPDHHTYEVHRLRMKPAHPDSADAGQLLLCSPSESEWGKHGWTYLTLAAAQEQFDTLVNQAGGIAA